MKAPTTRLLTLVLSSVLVIALHAAPARAQAVNVADHAADEWRFSITPYMFLPISTTGTSAVAGTSADVKLDGRDILENLNFALSARAEVGYGDFSVIVDGYYVTLGGGSTVISPGPAAAAVRVDVELTQAWFAMMGAYRFVEGTWDSGGARRYAVDAGAGFRYNAVRQEVTASVDIGIGPGLQTTLGGRTNWVEPVLMLRGGVEVAEDWSLGARGEIGGFGAGGDELQWNVLFGAAYDVTDLATLRLGWQFYGIDYATTLPDGRFEYDVFQTGPYMGATFRW